MLRKPYYLVLFLFFAAVVANKLQAQCIVTSEQSGSVYPADMSDTVQYTITITGAGSFLSNFPINRCGFNYPGVTTPWSGNTTGSSIIFTFSKPVTGIDVMIAATGVTGQIQPETFIFTTNNLVPTLTVDPGSCAAWILTGNQVKSPSVPDGLNAVVTVTSAPFTVLTIQCPDANGVNGGSFFGLCNTSFRGVCALDVSVAVNDSVITANLAGAAYQWLDCDNGFAPISGATGQSFTATSGNYAVQISLNGCIDTSVCKPVTTCPQLSLTFQASVAAQGLTTGAVKAFASGGSPPYLYSIDGAVFRASNIFTGLAPGIYQLYMTDSNGCPAQTTFNIEQANCACGAP